MGAFPLVLLSGNQNPVAPDVLEAAGIASQIAKPFHTQELIDHVKTQLGLELEKSVAAMRFIPRAAKPPVAEAPSTAPVVHWPQQAVSAPPVIKGPPPPAIKGPPPPAPASAIRAAKESALAPPPVEHLRPSSRRRLMKHPRPR